MKYQGNILKMDSQWEENKVVNYTLRFGNDAVLMNDLLGKHIKLSYQSQINCISCGSVTKKSFAQGYCYKCFISVPQTEECVLRPELCRAHEGEARDMEYAKTHCLIDHYVYLANSSALKVGVTRNTQIPTRWIDQGATQAIKLAKTPNRYTAGLIEVALKDHLSDKTNWRNMLKNQIDESIDLEEEKYRIEEQLPSDLSQYFCDDDTIYELEYPVIEYPDKIKSMGFDKQAIIEGTLMGIKGQYLIFDQGRVINMRKHNGYLVELETP